MRGRHRPVARSPARPQRRSITGKVQDACLSVAEARPGHGRALPRAPRLPHCSNICSPNPTVTTDDPNAKIDRLLLRSDRACREHLRAAPGIDHIRGEWSFFENMIWIIKRCLHVPVGVLVAGSSR
jgi:hypothetical protein